MVLCECEQVPAGMQLPNTDVRHCKALEVCKQLILCVW